MPTPKVNSWLGWRIFTVNIHKEAKGTHPWSPKKSEEKRPQIDELSDEQKFQEKASKNTEKETRENQQEHVRNHANLLYTPWKIYTRSSLPPQHPSLSQALYGISPWSFGFVAQPSNLTVFWWTATNPACRLRSWAATLHRLMSTTSSCFSFHHAACTWRRCPPGPSSRAYLSLHSSEAPQGQDLSCPLFTCTNTNQATTCTCNTRPRVSPHHVVNHSSQSGVTIHRSSDVWLIRVSFNSPLQMTFG
jgi:hypothetical protein